MCQMCQIKLYDTTLDIQSMTCVKQFCPSLGLEKGQGEKCFPPFVPLPPIKLKVSLLLCVVIELHVERWRGQSPPPHPSPLRFNPRPISIEWGKLFTTLLYTRSLDWLAAGDSCRNTILSAINFSVFILHFVAVRLKKKPRQKHNLCICTLQSARRQDQFLPVIVWL